MTAKSKRLTVLSEAEHEALYGLPDFDDGQQFLVALYSDGVLWMQLEDGQQVDLQPQETRALFQYLDRLGGTALAEALPCR